MQTSWMSLVAWAGLSCAALPAWCRGSNYGVEPGAPAQFNAKVRERPVPVPRFAREPVVTPDGNVYVAIMLSGSWTRPSNCPRPSTKNDKR